jgi:hypothetical protein
MMVGPRYSMPTESRPSRLGSIALLVERGSRVGVLVMLVFRECLACMQGAWMVQYQGDPNVTSLECCPSTRLPGFLVQIVPWDQTSVPATLLYNLEHIFNFHLGVKNGSLR